MSELATEELQVSSRGDLFPTYPLQLRVGKRTIAVTGVINTGVWVSMILPAQAAELQASIIDTITLKDSKTGEVLEAPVVCVNAIVGPQETRIPMRVAVVHLGGPDPDRKAMLVGVDLLLKAKNAGVMMA